MAKYPVDSEQDLTGIREAVNYVLSGPAGLGQNFAGFSSDDPVYVRPTFREPFTLPITTTLDPSWSLTIPITTVVTVGSNPTAELTVTFAAAQPAAPFQLGDLISLRNTVASGGDPDFYNTDLYVVLACTTTDCRIGFRLRGELMQQTWPGLSAPGGDLVREYYDSVISTDCNGRVSVQGGTDRVFINAQLVLDFDYTATMPSNFAIDVQIDRYKGFPNTAPGTTDYFFVDDGTVTRRTYNYAVSAGGTVLDLETIFTSIIEQNIPFGYYWYLLDIKFRKTDLAEGGLITDDLAYGYYLVSGTAAASATTPYAAYTGLSPVTVTGSGSGAVVDIYIYPQSGEAYSLVNNLSVIVTTPGTGYRPGDTISIAGNLIGGATPANDLTLEIVRVDDPGDAFPGKFVAKLRSLTAQVVKE